jgi:Na+/alanine symporter
MITFLGNGLIFWTGILAIVFMTLSFFGCICNMKFFKQSKIVNYLRGKHIFLMRTAFSLAVVHAVLALLGKYFGIYF